MHSSRSAILISISFLNFPNPRTSKMKLEVSPYMLKFRHPAGTSRGILTEKPTYILKLYDEERPDVYGLGEASVFPGLSPEADHRYEFKLWELIANVRLGAATDLSRFSSIQLGFEQAIWNFQNAMHEGGATALYYPSPFTEGEESITINGLVWMGSYEEMKQRVREKVDAGFKCIKLKIGAIDWKSELSLIQSLRNDFSSSDLEIRVDANGAFNADNVREVLDTLAALQVHSIEQPVAPSHPELLARLCADSPIPIALDEQLIGLYTRAERAEMLDRIRPAYIILKPSLCGGFGGAEEWIKLAEERGIGWWVTSALESNIGLNAIAQWTARLGVTLPQGLGTGGLYTNNFPSPLTLDADRLSFNPLFIPPHPDIQFHG